MEKYRFYCLNESRVDAVKVGEFLDDHQARETGEVLLRATGSRALEVWNRSTLVARLERAPIPNCDASR
jgi:hypothetical protein